MPAFQPQGLTSDIFRVVTSFHSVLLHNNIFKRVITACHASAPRNPFLHSLIEVVSKINSFPVSVFFPALHPSTQVVALSEVGGDVKNTGDGNEAMI